MAGEEFRKKTLAAIPGANEVGAIVSMWSMMEGMIALALEDGRVTKGNGQNLTVFYIKTENEWVRTLPVENRKCFWYNEQ